MKTALTTTTASTHCAKLSRKSCAFVCKNVVYADRPSWRKRNKRSIARATQRRTIKRGIRHKDLPLWFRVQLAVVAAVGGGLECMSMRTLCSYGESTQLCVRIETSGRKSQETTWAQPNQEEDLLRFKFNLTIDSFQASYAEQNILLFYFWLSIASELTVNKILLGCRKDHRL